LPITGPAQQLAVSPDGRTLAVAAVNFFELAPILALYRSPGSGAGVNVRELRFYDARKHRVKGRRLTDFAGARAPVYSSDGALLAYPMAGLPPSIAVRDARTLKLVHKLALDPLQLASYTPDLAHASILIAPDGHTVYCAYEDFSQNYEPRATFLARWSLPSGRLLSTTRIGGTAVLAVGLTNAGSRVVVVDPRTVTVYDARSGARRSRTALTPAAPSAVAISRDGHAIAIASDAGAVTFIDVASGHARHGIGPNAGSAASLAYSPDGRTVASTTHNTAIIWNPRSATLRTVLNVPGGQVQGATFTPDGRALYTSSVGGLVLESDLTGERRFGRRVTLAARSPCCEPVAPLAPPLAVSPDGATFAARVGHSTVGLFSATTLQRQATFTVKPAGAVITALAWSPAAPELAVGGSSGLVQLWRTDDTPHRVRSLYGLQPIPGQDQHRTGAGSATPREPEAISGLGFSPDGRLIAASDNSETNTGITSLFSGNPQTITSEVRTDRLSSLAIWRTRSGTLSTAPIDLGPGSGPFDPLAFSPDGRLLAVSAPDGRDLVVNATTAQIRQTLRPIGGDFTGSLAFAPDGTLATGTLSGIVQQWNPISGAQLARPLPVTAGAIASIAFDPAGSRFVTTASQDGTVKLFATSTLQQQGATLDTGQHAAPAATFTSHGSSLLVVNDYGTGFTWPTSLTSWEQRACAVAGRNLTQQEWTRYLPGQDYAPVCP
jgi:WD40 repeat protein